MLLKRQKVHKPIFVIASCIAFLCILGFVHDQGWVQNAKAAVSPATVPSRVSAAGDQKPLTNNCINPSIGDACINGEALDGTGGRLGVRHFDSNVTGPLFADPKSYLRSADYKAYQKWTAWSQKPASMDFVVPSKEYFSMGRTKNFTGDLALPGMMFNLIQARAHKKELIQFIVGDEGSLALGLNFAFTLRNLGYDHWFAFGGEDDTICRKFMQAMPDGACVWNTVLKGVDPPKYSKIVPNRFLLWWFRWLHVAQILRFRHNILNLDIDVLLTDDVYKYFKPPSVLSNIIWTCGDEHAFGISGCNGGTNYIQNAAPDGVVMWMVAQIVEREARAMESWPAYENITAPTNIIMDQITQNAVINTARIGIMQAQDSLQRLANADGVLMDWDVVSKEKDLHPYTSEEIAVPLEWQERHGIKMTCAMSLPPSPNRGIQLVKVTKSPVLQIPPPGYPKDYTDIFLAPRGPFVTRLLNEINDMGTAPPVPDWETPVDKRGPLPEERIHKAHALIRTWSDGYREGQWWGHKPPRGLIEHTVFLRSGFFARPFFFKVAGWWHWKVDDLRVEVGIENAPYPTSTAVERLPRVLAYPPSLTFNGMSLEDYHVIIFNLALAAILSERAFVLPLVPCDSEWLLQPGHKCSGGKSCWYHDIPIFYEGEPMESIPIIDASYPPHVLTCQAWEGFEEFCFAERLMLHADFKQLVTIRAPRAGRKSTLKPVPGNTLNFDSMPQLERSNLVLSALTRAVSAEKLASELAEFKEQQVVYLGQVPLIVGASGNGNKSVGWVGHDDVTVETPLVERVSKFFQGCRGFMMTKESIQNLTDIARKEWAHQSTEGLASF